MARAQRPVLGGGGRPLGAGAGDRPLSASHLHLHPIGGLAGDMFCAALLDARPGLFEPLQQVIAGLQPPAGVGIRLVAADGPLSGRRFLVAAEPHHDHHHHTHYREIRELLDRAPLTAAVRARAQAIFRLLAEAEGRIHGMEPDEVAFHEVGNWDSIIDCVSAAFLLDACGVASCSTEPLPIGGGRVQTAHGILPVPAPATALLLRGLPLIDDGIGGERVTPTGAAILRALAPGPRAVGGTLRQTGFGFGSRRLDGVPNCVQALLIETAGADAGPYRCDRVVELAFEVDDQVAEDLAIALDRLRAVDGVHSVTTLAGIGKQGRVTQQIQLLAREEAEQAVIAACFSETTTIGLRRRISERLILRREAVTVEVDGRSIEVKRVRRPGGVTAKAEQRSVASVAGHAERQRLRELAEQAAMGQNGADGETDE